MTHEPFTRLDQEQLDWISRFADRLRLEDPSFADERRSERANDIARTVWEEPGWRDLEPEVAAQRWLSRRGAR